MVALRTRKPTEIKATAFYRVTVKATGETFYCVPSDSGDGMYEVTRRGWDAATGRHLLACQCYDYCKHIASDSRYECKHCRAVQCALSVKAEEAQARLLAEAVQVAEEAQREAQMDADGLPEGTYARPFESCVQCGRPTRIVVCTECAPLDCGLV